MARPHDTWKVLPHGPIEKLTENLWRVEGTLDGGPPLKRIMAVVKRADGRLVIHNAIALDEARMKELEAWGDPAEMIVPNGYHRLDAPAFAKRYPKMKVFAPRGARKKVAEVVKVDGELEELGQDAVLKAAYVGGVAEAEGLLEVESEDGTSVVLTDCLFNMPHLPGAKGFLLRHVTGSSGGPRVSRLAQWFLVKNKAGLRASFEQLAALPRLKRVLVAHHETITGDVPRVLREVAATL